jgi:hypothetical protein
MAPFFWTKRDATSRDIPSDGSTAARLATLEAQVALLADIVREAVVVPKRKPARKSRGRR